MALYRLSCQPMSDIEMKNFALQNIFTKFCFHILIVYMSLSQLYVTKKSVIIRINIHFKLKETVSVGRISRER